MIISVNTLFPDLYTTFFRTSLIGKALDKKLVTCNLHNMLSLCEAKERVDGPTFGHHAGMIIKPTVIERAVNVTEACAGKSVRVFFSPRGQKLTQDLVRTIAHTALTAGHLSLYAARYEGIDTRAEQEYADYIVSIGDYVLMGGDLPAQILLEAVARYIPGVIGDQESVERDSFTGPFVDCPAYTAPAVWRNREVPPVLRSGNHKDIANWCRSQSIQATLLEHFDWLRTHNLSPEDRAAVAEKIPSHYVALMHDEIMLPPDRVGTTSVTSLDIHDIARSATTYNFAGFFIVTPLQDQQKIVQTLLNFWREGDGIGYNPDRHKALSHTALVSSYTEVIQAIEHREGKSPLVIATSARSSNTTKNITYHDQGLVWRNNRPVLFLLGTGRGLAQQVLDRADYILDPITSFAEFNHLSVRSAAAIIFDRWLGLKKKRM